MITGSIITYNESRNIVACIESLKLICDEIFVIDSLSTDDTVALARAHGARIIEHQYLGDGPQRNLLLDDASHDWIMSLDADERMTPELATEIRALDLANSPFDAYAMKRRNYIGSRWVRHCGWYPDYVVRLYHRMRTRHGDGKSHASDLPTRNIFKLEQAITHLTHENVSEVFAKPGRDYHSRAAKILYLKGKKVNPLSPALHGGSAFLKHYIFKLGFLDGLDGLTVCLGIALRSYGKYARLIEFYRDPEIRKREDFDRIW
ncbi:MAG: glycosyltransferase family 2 protein [Xanthomonadales bacterium]|nr:glycosyltransferase family 2 protein [Xanthomonadales bacterium]